MNETTRMHLQLRRNATELEQLRAQLKHALGLIATLRTDLESWAKKAGVLAPGHVPTEQPLPGNTAMPTGVSTEVQEPGP